MSLRNKILLLSALPVGIVMIIVATVTLLHVRDAMMDAAKEELMAEVEIAAHVIDEVNKDAVRLARMLAEVQMEGMFGKREESLALTRKILDTYPRFIGAYFTYEPDADGGDAEWLAKVGPNHPSTDSTGRFLPYRFRDLRAGGRIELEPQVAMETSLYYNGMKERFEADAAERHIITEPYIYNAGNLIVEQTSPIVIDGEFAGIAGVDRGLNYLDEYLTRLKLHETADLTLVSGGGRIVATTLTNDVNVDLRTVSIDELYLHSNGTIATELFMVRDGQTVLDPAKATPAKLATLRDDFVKELRGFVDDAKIPFVRQFMGLLTGTELYAVSAWVPTGEWTLIMTVGTSYVTEPIRDTVQWTVLVSILGILLVAGILMRLANQVSRRIQSVSGLARAVADGDLTAHVVVETSDETGVLQQAIKDMLQSLNGLISKVKMSSIGLMSTSNAIAAGSRQQEAAVNEFSSSTNQITAAAKEISATSRELLGTVNDLKGVADETANLADAGHSNLNGMASTMGGLIDATAAISARLATISEKAGNINVVVTTISKVADQTNLLSLNASIEAEKAGEYGLGFAVVAREIRRLADQTAMSTTDIEQMVKEMQTAVSSGVMEMDKFTDEVRRGAAEVQQVGSQLEEIIRQVQTLTARFGVVSDGMESQSEGARQISDALVGFSEGVEQTATTIKDFHRAAESLQKAVGDLRTEISRFRVEERGGGGEPS